MTRLPVAQGIVGAGMTRLPVAQEAPASIDAKPII
jgi:hypothetical protein